MAGIQAFITGKVSIAGATCRHKLPWSIKPQSCQISGLVAVGSSKLSFVKKHDLVHDLALKLDGT